MEERINLTQCVGDNEFTIVLPALNDLERAKIVKKFYDKKPIRVNFLGQFVYCYISTVFIKKIASECPNISDVHETIERQYKSKP